MTDAKSVVTATTQPMINGNAQIGTSEKTENCSPSHADSRVSVIPSAMANPPPIINTIHHGIFTWTVSQSNKRAVLLRGERLSLILTSSRFSFWSDSFLRSLPSSSSPWIFCRLPPQNSEATQSGNGGSSAGRMNRSVQMRIAGTASDM